MNRKITFYHIYTYRIIYIFICIYILKIFAINQESKAMKSHEIFIVFFAQEMKLELKMVTNR